MTQLDQVREKLSKLDKSKASNIRWNSSGAEVVSMKDLYENNKEIIQIARIVFTKSYEAEVKKSSESANSKALEKEKNP